MLDGHMGNNPVTTWDLNTALAVAKAVEPYDLFFFEVLVGDKMKLLHEMRPGERGSMVVSTPILPRYRIGDLILAKEPPYFRCIGREEWWVPLRYGWDEFMSFNLGRL